MSIRLKLQETQDAVEIAALMPTGARVALFLIGVFPFTAPYELLVRPGWHGWWNPVFVVSALISAGAVVIAIAVLAAAVAGKSQHARFDRRLGHLELTEWAPVVRRRVSIVPFRFVAAIDLHTKEWTEGTDTYSVRVTTTEGKVVDVGSFSSHEETEGLVGRLRTMVFGGPGTRRT